MLRTLKKPLSYLVLCSIACWTLASAQALEEIVVTAQKREQNIQDVGISITALTGNQLGQLGISNSEDLMNVVPGLVIGSFGSQATTTPTIRGVSQNDFADHEEPPVALYVDGAYNSFIGGAGFNMFDVQRVEVLRGPQGTLFGRNSTGGLLQIVTRKPTENFDAYGEVNVGEYNLIRFEGAVSGPITKQLLARLSIATNNNDGYIKNTIGHDLQGTNNYSGRLQLEFLPTDNITALLKIHGSRDNVKGSVGYETPRAIFSFSDPAALVFNPTSQAQYVAFCNGLFDANTPAPMNITNTSTCSGWEDPKIKDPYTTAIDNPGYMDRKTYGVTGTVTWDVNDSIKVTSLTDYLVLKRNYSEDTDGTAFSLFNFYSFMNSDQFSQELRVNAEGERTRWVAGAYYLTIHHDITTGIDARANAYTLANANPDVLFPFLTRNNVNQKTESWALFGQAEYDFMPGWTAIGGVRYSHDNKTIDITPSCDPAADIFGFTCFLLDQPGTIQGDGYVGAQSSGLISAKFELDWHPSDKWLVYAGVTRGVKGGGFNAGAIAGLPESAASYKPEILVDYEGGFKSTLFDDKARFNGSVFYYDYKNYQAFTLTGLTPTVFNTDASVKGFELELTANPWEGLTTILGMSYLDARAYNVPNNLLPGAVNLGTQRMPQAPKWSYDGVVRYQWPMFNGTMAIQGDLTYVGRRVFNTVNHPALFDGAYTLVNGRLSYTTQDDKWTLALWVKNLTAARYTSFAFDFSGSDGTAPATVNPPRWVGGTISYKY